MSGADARSTFGDAADGSSGSGRAAVADRPNLHVPGEPVALQRRWLDDVLLGASLSSVLAEGGGLADWLWQRWSVLAGVGTGRATFGEIVDGYRREIWLWMAGERTWEQCCSGLIGRVYRRMST